MLVLSHTHTHTRMRGFDRTGDQRVLGFGLENAISRGLNCNLGHLGSAYLGLTTPLGKNTLDLPTLNCQLHLGKHFSLLCTLDF